MLKINHPIIYFTIKSTILFLILFQTNLLRATEDWQWPQANPEEVGLKSELLAKAHRQIKRKKYHLVDSMLVVRHGKLVFEKYYNNGRKSRAHRLASAGKSVLSALIGITIDKKNIEGVDIKIYDIFKSYFSEFENWDKDKASINLHNLLTMRAGWDCHIQRKESRCGSLMKQGRSTSEAIKWVLDRPMNYKPGERMQYTDAITTVLNLVVFLANQQSSKHMYQDYLFGPMGISTQYNGSLTSRQMAMFGQLFLNKGTWEEKRVISEDWVNKSTSPIHSFTAAQPGITQGYGYLWWIGEFKSKTTDLSVDGYYAGGNGGQYIVVLPELDMVVVFTGSNFNKIRRMGKSLSIIEDYILPAIIEEPAVTQNE